MKRIASIGVILLFMGPILTHAQIQQIYENPDYGPDSASRMNCANHLSTMSEFMKIDLPDYALQSWKIAFNECPAASKNIYLYGIQIYRDRVSNETDPAAKASKLDTLMMIYDRRIVHFGEEGLVIGRKGLDLLRYDPRQVETAYEYLKRSLELSGPDTEEAVIVTLMQTCNFLYKAGSIESSELIDNYLTECKILARKLESGKNQERATAALENVEAIFANSGAADCKALVDIFTPMFKETPEDLAFLKKITALLSDQKCEETELYASASENLYRLEPSSLAAYQLAKLFVKKQNWDKAVRYYKEAISGATGEDEEAKYHYELGLILFTRYDDFQQARSHAREAIAKRPGWGAPYILIGNLYASSSNMCGENDFEKTTIFWAAVDKFETARAMDSEVNGEATELIRKYSQYFPNVEDAFFYGFEDGQDYTVGCWINENTTVRTRKRP